MDIVPDESDGRSVRTEMRESTEVTSLQIWPFEANAIRDNHLGMLQTLKRVVENRQKEQL